MTKTKTYLDCTVKEATVLSWLIEKSFGGSQGQHGPWLVNPAKIAPWFPEELYPCHLTVGGETCCPAKREALSNADLVFFPSTG